MRLDSFNGKVLESSEHFFAPSPVGAADFDFDGSRLHFPSGILSPYQVNNTVHARFFESPGSDRAVIVSPNGTRTRSLTWQSAACSTAPASRP